MILPQRENPLELILSSFSNVAFRMNKPIVVIEAGEGLRFYDYYLMERMQGILNVMKHFIMISNIEPNYIGRKSTIPFA